MAHPLDQRLAAGRATDEARAPPQYTRFRPNGYIPGRIAHEHIGIDHCRIGPQRLTCLLSGSLWLRFGEGKWRLNHLGPDEQSD
jgi:hypothetical protein